MWCLDTGEGMAGWIALQKTLISAELGMDFGMILEYNAPRFLPVRASQSLRFHHPVTRSFHTIGNASSTAHPANSAVGLALSAIWIGND